MHPELAMLFLGAGYAGMACLLGLFAPVLWPKKDLTRANVVLTLAYRFGICMMLGSALAFVAERLS